MGSTGRRLTRLPRAGRVSFRNMRLGTLGRTSVVAVLGLMAAGGLGFTLDARQTPAHPVASTSGLFTFVDEYCLS
jgi:hypothetical protein